MLSRKLEWEMLKPLTMRLLRIGQIQRGSSGLTSEADNDYFISAFINLTNDTLRFYCNIQYHSICNMQTYTQRIMVYITITIIYSLI